MNKNKIYDILIIILLYVGISCIPFSLIPISNSWILLFQILSQILIFFLIKFVLKKSQLKTEIKNQDSKKVMLFIPLVIVCFSNFFCLLDPNNYFRASFGLELLLSVLLSIAVAFNEEIIFRLLLLGNMSEDKKPLYRIFISSIIFALCHLTHFLSSFNPADLVVVIYTFGIGIILGMIYLYANSIIFAFIFHALYNVGNNNLASNWIHYENGFTSFYLINIIVGVVAALYLVSIYFLRLRKEKNN